MEKYLISAMWRHRPLPLGQVTEMTKCYLKGLSSLHPVFERWVGLGRTSFVPLDYELKDLQKHIAIRGYDRKCIKEYTHLDENDEFTDASMAELGFSCTLFTYDPESSDQHRSTNCGGIKLSLGRLGLASSSMHSMINLSLPTDRYGELHDPVLVRKMLEWTVKVWQPRSCNARSLEFIDAYQGKSKIRELYASWMTYVDFPLLKDCLPADLPCPYEVMPDGGLLFTLTPERPSTDNSEDVERGRKLQSIFESLHLCQAEHVLNGWPYAPLESEYKTQITGAPADRAYVVKMAYFDGYDAKRDVLLFASLLQSLSPYFLDFEKYDRIKFPFYEDQIEENTYVLEAHRQMDAVRLAGASTPIEWHIGVEENYEKLCRLFEMAGIDGDRLSVHFTPYQGI